MKINNQLNEDRRSDLITRSKRAKKERDGKTRYQKRVKSRVSSNTKNYNRIDMNKLFKDNILNIDIGVNGETDNYNVKISFGGFLDNLNKEIRLTNKLELRDVIRALLDCFNKENVYIHCSCPDWKYRMAYWATLDEINSGTPELIPSDETNPDNELGPGCKHVMLVLANNSWLIKVASVINNYIKYMEKHMEKMYADIIYPAIYKKKYEKPVQTSIFDKDELDTDEETIDKSNEEGRVRGRFKPGNKQGIRFAPKEDEDQITIDDISVEDEETNN